MKENNDKLIEIIVEQAVQLEIVRLKNKELSLLVRELAEQLVKYAPPGQIELPDSSIYI